MSRLMLAHRARIHRSTLASCQWSRALWNGPWISTRQQAEKSKLEQDEMKMKMKMKEQELELLRLQLAHQEQLQKTMEQEAENLGLQLAQEGRRIQKEEDSATEELLMKPRVDLLRTATTQVATLDPDSQVLKQLETVGFSYYMDPVFFKTDNQHVEQNVKDVLHAMPEKSRSAIARFLATSQDAYGKKVFFEFNDGRGELTHLVYKTVSRGGVKSIALLPYGTTFECSKVVEKFEEKTEAVPIYERVAKEVKDSAGLFSTSYKTEWENQYVKTEYSVTKIPVFKQHVLDVDKQHAMMRALEFQAHQKALTYLS